MKNLYAPTIFILLLCHTHAYAQVYKSFQTRYNLGVSLELLGVSPSVGANIEWMALNRSKSFIDVQLGIGIISLPTDIWSFSQLVTYNYWLNQRNNTRRKDCNPEKKERRAEYFIEAGIGNLIIAGQMPSEQRDFIMPVTGLRAHFPISRKSVIFAKLRYIPYIRSVYQSEFGVALGVSL